MAVLIFIASEALKAFDILIHLHEGSPGNILTVFSDVLSAMLHDSLVVPDSNPSAAVGSNFAIQNPNSSPLNWNAG